MNCQHCTNYHCKKIRETGGFRYWYCFMAFCYQDSTKRKRNLEKELVSAAKEFLEFDIYFSGGIYICKAPYGDYVWHFAVRMKQYQLWDLPEFREGYEFGLNPKKPFRDANPYNEPERKYAWDCGYILGLHENEK